MSDKAEIFSGGGGRDLQISTSASFSVATDTAISIAEHISILLFGTRSPDRFFLGGPIFLKLLC